MKTVKITDEAHEVLKLNKEYNKAKSFSETIIVLDNKLRGK